MWDPSRAAFCMVKLFRSSENSTVSPLFTAGSLNKCFVMPHIWKETKTRLDAATNLTYVLKKAV